MSFLRARPGPGGGLARGRRGPGDPPPPGVRGLQPAVHHVRTGGENAPLLVAKRSGEKQPFDREKLISGVRKACKNRPVLPEAMERVADDIVETLRLEGRSVVSTADLGRDVLERLRDIDEVAYLRFASVYKDFKELNDFERELGLLAKKVPPKQPAGVPEE